MNRPTNEELKMYKQWKFWKRATHLYFHMSTWFSENEPGTPVPEWCLLSWPIREEEVEELIKLYEQETGKDIEEP